MNLKKKIILKSFWYFVNTDICIFKKIYNYIDYIDITKWWIKKFDAYRNYIFKNLHNYYQKNFAFSKYF